MITLINNMSTTLYNQDRTYRNNRIRIAVDLLLNDYNFFSTQQSYDNSDNFYVYDESNGVYLLDAEMFIVDRLNELFPNSFQHYSHIRSVINQIQHWSPIVPIDQINPKGITNYINGLYFHNENTLKPHNPTIFTTKQFPYNFITESKLLISESRLQALNYID